MQGGEDPGEGAKTKKMKFVPIVKKKKDKKSGETQKKIRGSSSNPTSTAAFHELMEAAQSEADWERGSGRRQRDHTMGAVAFGTSSQAGGMLGQGVRNAWGGASASSAVRVAGGGGRRGTDSARSGPSIKLESVKEEKLHEEFFFSKKKAEEELLDFSAYYPTFLPFSTDQAASHIPNASLIKDIVTDSTEEYSAADELNFFGENKGMMLFQLPGVLPVAAAQNQVEDKRKAAHAKAHIPTAKEIKQAMKPHDLTGGRIGKLLIFKSGKVKMRIGEVLLDVSPGIPYPCRQDVVGIHMGPEADESHCVFMGPVGTKPVCTLDIFQLLSVESLPDFHTYVGKQGDTQQTKQEESDLLPGPLPLKEDIREESRGSPVTKPKDIGMGDTYHADEGSEEEIVPMLEESQFDFMEEDGQAGEASDMDEYS